VQLPCENWFFGAMWLHQHGYPVVALMGSSCSETQAELLVSIVHHEGWIWLMPDGDEPGTRMAHALFEQVSPYRFMRCVKMEPHRLRNDSRIPRC